jgi:glutaredoxin
MVEYYMNKSVILTIIITLIILVSGVFLLTRTSTLPPITNLEYYWGNGCPHCKVVAEFMDTWDNPKKVVLEKFEVWYNSKNARRFNERVKICNFKPEEMGVPVLITPDGKCFTGDTPIIDHLKSL